MQGTAPPHLRVLVQLVPDHDHVVQHPVVIRLCVGHVVRGAPQVLLLVPCQRGSEGGVGVVVTAEKGRGEAALASRHLLLPCQGKVLIAVASPLTAQCPAWETRGRGGGGNGKTGRVFYHSTTVQTIKDIRHTNLLKTTDNS